MDDSLAYIEGFISSGHPVLKELEKEHRNRDDVPPHIGIHVGTFLAWLIQVLGAKRALEFGTAIGYPTVPQGKARIRVMISAAHSKDDLDQGLEAFSKVGKKLGVI